MKNYILGIATIIVIGILVFATYLYGKQNIQKEALPAAPAITESQGKPTSTLTPTPTINKESDNALIKKALFQKNNWKDDGTTTFTVSTNDGKYASGGVTGGYFYAIKIGDKWEIVADGNGVILCSSLVKYPDFPKTLIPECYNDQTQKTVKR